MSVPNGPVSPEPVVVVIFTTAGPAFAAASMTAEDSSMVTGCCAPVCWLVPIEVVVTVGSSAPVATSPTMILTNTEPVTGAIEAYETFDQRRPGWIKVELNPAA